MAVPLELSSVEKHFVGREGGKQRVKLLHVARVAAQKHGRGLGAGKQEVAFDDALRLAACVAVVVHICSYLMSKVADLP